LRQKHIDVIQYWGEVTSGAPIRPAACW